MLDKTGSNLSRISGIVEKTDKNLENLRNDCAIDDPMIAAERHLHALLELDLSTLALMVKGMQSIVMEKGSQ